MFSKSSAATKQDITELVKTPNLSDIFDKFALELKKLKQEKKFKALQTKQEFYLESDAFIRLNKADFIHSCQLDFFSIKDSEKKACNDDKEQRDFIYDISRLLRHVAEILKNEIPNVQDPRNNTIVTTIKRIQDNLLDIRYALLATYDLSTMPGKTSKEIIGNWDLFNELYPALFNPCLSENTVTSLINILLGQEKKADPLERWVAIEKLSPIQLTMSATFYKNQKEHYKKLCEKNDSVLFKRIQKNSEAMEDIIESARVGHYFHFNHALK